jgi:hypothetical protein
MNKSTPLSQLPNAAQQQTSFVNDQQKQMVTNAQAAVQNINMPQNTQIPPEIINDDDATIQEVLNQINSQKGGNNLPPPSMQHHVEMMTQQAPPPMMDMGSMMMMPPGSAYQPTYYPPQPPPMIPSSTGSSIELFVQFFADDIKLATLIFAVFVGVHFLPIGSLLSRYVAIDKIPYHDLLLKGIVATVIVIVAKKMISSTKQ